MSNSKRTKLQADEIAALHYANVVYWREGAIHSREAMVEYQRRQDRLQEIRTLEPAQEAVMASHSFPFIPNPCDWEKFYQAAIQEKDWSKMQDRIETAKLAIRYRLYEFSQNHRAMPEENEAIADAVDRLAILHEKVTSWREAS